MTEEQKAKLKAGREAAKAQREAAKAAAAGEGPVDQQPESQDDDWPTVIITVDHVYLPMAGEDRTHAEWQNVQVTERVDKRRRLKAPPSLAQFLSERDQAEIV